eukprot:492496_1
MSPLFPLIVHLLMKIVMGQADECKWSQNNREIDLSNLQQLSNPIECIYYSILDEVERQYLFLPCQDSMPCDDAGNQMIAQMNINNGNCRGPRSFTWDSSVSPSFDSNSQFTFTYTGDGNSDCPPNQDLFKRIQITYTCDPNAIPYGNVVCSDGWDTNGWCLYHMNIATVYACFDGNEGANNSVLSGGSIFLICFFAAIFLYCFIGYMFNVYRLYDKEDTYAWTNVKTNIPNYSLFTYFVQLIGAGCHVSFELVKNKLSKKDADVVE